MKKLIYVCLAALLVSGCGEGDGVRPVPEKSCEYKKTGKTRDAGYFQCTPMGNNPCGIQTYIPLEEAEYQVVCSFKEYR